MPGFAAVGGFVAGLLLLLVLYIRVNDKRLQALPETVAPLSRHRVTPEDVRALAERISTKPLKLEEELVAQLPPKTGRRYIVIGGGGFLGGWLVVKLLQRGEDPKRIRVFDLNEPVNFEVQEARGRGLQYYRLNVADYDAVEAAFKDPWNDGAASDTGVSVFHTAANIRFWERHPVFLPRSTKVNVEGTRNIIRASKLVGADVLVYTSSASVGVKSIRALLWPWESEPKDLVQLINDDDDRLPKSHWEYFCNYAVTKRMAEVIVREADRTDGLRTGAIRPGNGIFGSRGDLICGACLVRQTNPNWIPASVQSFCYVENCALAHLLYERRLLDLIEQEKAGGNRLPDIGGQAFCVADPGPPQTWGDTHMVLKTLDKECTFIYISPTAMLLLAYLVEAYYVSQHFVTASVPFLAKVFPPITGEIMNVQTSLFSLTLTHLIVDDSRARLSPEKGGLGYRGAWTTLEGLYKTWQEFDSGIGKSDARSHAAGISFGLRKKVKKEMGDGIAIPVVPVEVTTAR